MFKYTGINLISASSAKNTTVCHCNKAKSNRINKFHGQIIWVFLDASTNQPGRHIATCVAGILHNTLYSNPSVINMEFLSSINSTTIS